MEAPPKTAPRLFLIDAYALIYRSFFAFIHRPLTNSRGENTSAAWGVANFLFRIREEQSPDYLAVVFDAGRSNREKKFPEYKATREKMPEELRAGLPRIRELIDAFHGSIIEVEGYEADDLIGTLATQAREAGLEAVIVSGDKDFYQLIAPGIHLLNPGRGGPHGVAAEWVTEANAAERFGLPPERIVDYLALVGDSSDNVPGAPGVGPKTAVSLLQEFGNLEILIERAGEVKGKRAREALQGHADQIRLSKWLVTIQRDTPVELDLESLRVRTPDAEALQRVLIELEFRTLLDRIPVEGQEPQPKQDEVERNYRIIKDAGGVAALAKRLRRLGRFGLEVRTGSEFPMESEMVGIAVALGPGEAAYLPFRHHSTLLLELGDLGGTDEGNLPPLRHDSLRPLLEVLEDSDIEKVGRDLKRDLMALWREDVRLAGLGLDVVVASYVLDPSRRQHGLEDRAAEELAVAVPALKELVGVGQKEVAFSQVEMEAAAEYSCLVADMALRLRELLAPRLQEHGLLELYGKLELPLIPVLAGMERAGIRIDGPFFEVMGKRLARDLRLIREEIFKVTGEEFNLNSTPKLREILFERLGLPILKRTKTGPSTDASVLEELAGDGHQIPRLLLEYRQLEKLRSTYVDALPRLVNRRTARIHTRFNQAVAATGRLSSSDPNLQNIPIRTELGREVRKGFVPEPGMVFLAADYSQVELRILAHFSEDQAFVKAFREGIDVHRQTASVIFEVDIDAVTPDMRARAKTINFATLYGQGDFSLARQLGISRGEAKEFIEGYFERFAGVRNFLDEQIEMAQSKGYVETLSGRRRYIPELRSRNWNVRQFGERVAQNTPIQGTAADLIKLAMIDVAAALQESGTRARLLLQVHDELLLEVPPDEVEEVQGMVVRCMVDALSLTVPLAVDVGVGDSWYACKS